MRDILLNMKNQLIVETGARGTGKSTLAATFLPPSKVGQLAVQDSENSWNTILENYASLGLEVGSYTDMRKRFSGLPDEDDLLNRISRGNFPWTDNRQRTGLIDYYEYAINDMMKTLEHNKYTVMVMDTIEKIEAGMAAWVDVNKKSAGVTTTAYGKLWTDGVFPLYDFLLASLYQRGVNTIILTSHLKTPWEGNRPVAGKVVPSGKKILYFLSSLFVWLVKEPMNFDGAPAGLIMKERLSRISLSNDDDWNVQRRIPIRVPHMTWADIEKYLRDGCDLQRPADGEVPSQEERELMEELITDKQMQLMILDAQIQSETIKSQNSLGGTMLTSPDVLAASTNVLQQDGENRRIIGDIRKGNPEATPQEIKEMLASQGIEVSLPRVMAAMKA